MTDYPKSSADIEREVEAQRAGIAQTLDEISTRLTPGQILDEAWEFARGTGGGAFVRNLGTSARDNPLPVGLITAGIAWLVSGRGGGLSRRRPEPVDEYFRVGRVARENPPAGEESGFGRDGEGPGILSSAADSVAATAASARDTLGSTAEKIGLVSRVAVDDAVEGAGHLRQSALEQGRRLGKRVRETGREAQARASSFADEQPIVLAAAGIALGALVGALVRGTSAESRLVGEASDRVKDRARNLAARGFEHGAGVVERTYEAVSDEAGRQGLTPASAGNAASELADKVTKVAKKGRAKLEEEIGGASGGAHTPPGE